MDRMPIGGSDNRPNILRLDDFGDVLDGAANRNIRLQLFRDIIEEEDEDIFD